LRPGTSASATRAASSETAVGVHEPVRSFGSPVSSASIAAKVPGAGGTSSLPAPQRVMPAGASGLAKSMRPNWIRSSRAEVTLRTAATAGFQRSTPAIPKPASRYMLELRSRTIRTLEIPGIERSTSASQVAS